MIRVSGATTYNPYRSAVPEFVSDYSQVFEFDADGLGNMTSKVSTETVSPQKSIGDNLNYSFDYVYDENYAHRLVRAGERYYQYDANGNVTCEQDAPAPKAQSSITSSNANDGQSPAYGSFEDNGDDPVPVEFSTDYGWGLFKDGDEGGHGASAPRYRRTYAWNERNQLISSVDANYSTAYVYGQDGQRSNKYTQSSETLYFNKMWTLHTDSGNNVYGGQTAKNIYLGETRIVTKLNSGSSPTYQEEYYKQYFYHSDHLGSASLISDDYKGDEYQRIEYTPYGETWVEKTSNTGLEFLPYKFTAKELDKETGLYYYGARYLDPKYSRWISTDPALGEYIPQAPTDEEAKRHNQNLPGMGGVFNTVNASLYHYAGNNPVKYTDPDGRETDDTFEGKAIHLLITSNYQAVHKGDTVYGNKAMSTAMQKMGLVDKGLGKTDLGVRPDIWNVTTNEMYEIKPATQGEAVAQEQLMGYIILANKYGIQGVKAGSSDAPGTSGNFTLAQGISVTYWSPSPGVILYSKNKLPKPQMNFNVDFESSPCTSILIAILGLELMRLTGIPAIP